MNKRNDIAKGWIAGEADVSFLGKWLWHYATEDGALRCRVVESKYTVLGVVGVRKKGEGAMGSAYGSIFIRAGLVFRSV